MYSIEIIKEKTIPIFKEYKVNKALLFGSYAKNNMRKDSDIDILVDSGLQGITFFALLEDLTDKLKMNVDLIDVCQVEKKSPIFNEINNTGVVLYERKN